MSKDDKEMRVPVDWEYPDGLDSVYASNFIIQHGLEEFYISFFEMPPPIVLGTAEEREEQISKIESVRAKCVARVVLTPTRIPALIAALEENYDKYLAKQDVNLED